MDRARWVIWFAWVTAVAACASGGGGGAGGGGGMGGALTRGQGTISGAVSSQLMNCAMSGLDMSNGFLACETVAGEPAGITNISFNNGGAGWSVQTYTPTAATASITVIADATSTTPFRSWGSSAATAMSIKIAEVMQVPNAGTQVILHGRLSATLGPLNGSTTGTVQLEIEFSKTN